MSQEKLKAVTSAGGKASRASEKGYVFSHDDAMKGAKKGGEATIAKYGAAHMVALGRIGGSRPKPKKADAPESERSEP